MGKNNDILDAIGEIYLLYKFKWIIVIGIIFFLAVFFMTKPDLDKEYQEYGYFGWLDKIKYDEFTDEIIPKSEIETYNNDSKYIIKSNGEKVYFSQIKAQRMAYEQVQGTYAFIAKKRVEQVRNICNILLTDYFELNYTIEKVKDLDSYQIHIRDITINGIYHEDYEIGSISDMERFIKYLVKGIYREQNGLEAQYGN